MSNRQYRVLIIASHPVQYAVPLFRRMATHPQLDIQVAYCSLQGAEAGIDPGFGIEVTWDISLLDGYSWVQVPNRSPKPGLGQFWGLINPQLKSLVEKGNFDGIVLLTGYAYASFWIAAAAAKWNKIPLLFGTDAHDLNPRYRYSWKTPLKRWILPVIFRWADRVTVTSSGGVQFMQSLGIPASKIELTPYVVDNEWWTAQSQRVDQATIRQQWMIPENASVVLFCAKLQPWKRPQDVLQAYANANVANSYLVIAGEGPLRAELEARIQALNLSERVRFLGFVNQSQLPAVYRSADLFVLPSEYEPFGLVVNESMLCGCPAVVSDRVGARYDLIQPGQTGWIYPCGNVDRLTEIFTTVLLDSSKLEQVRHGALERMKSWSPHENIAALIKALEEVVPEKNTRVAHSSKKYFTQFTK